MGGHGAKILWEARGGGRGQRAGGGRRRGRKGQEAHNLRELK